MPTPELYSRVRLVAAVLQHLAYAPPKVRSTVQLRLVDIIRDVLPGSKVQFHEARAVVPSGSFDEASEYVGLVTTRKGEAFTFNLRIQKSESGGTESYEGVWSRTDKATKTIAVKGTSLDALLTNLSKELNRNLVV